MSADPRRIRVARLIRVLGAAALLALPGPALAAVGSVPLHWTAPGDDGDIGRATSYMLRYSTTPVSGADTTSWWAAATAAAGLPAPQPAGSAESFTVAGLDSGATYYFIIRAVDDANNVADFSNVAVKQAGATGTVVLATPSGFSARAATRAVDLSWQALTSGAGSGYHLYRSTGASAADTLLGVLPVDATAYTDTTVAAGTQYTYRLAAFQGTAEGVPAVAQVSMPGDLLAAAATGIHGYPNPAHGSVTFRFLGGTRTGEAGSTHIAIYDLTGRRIRDLLHGVVPAGEQTIQWNGRSDHGQLVAPGVYNVILDGPAGRSTTRIALVP